MLYLHCVLWFLLIAIFPLQAARTQHTQTVRAKSKEDIVKKTFKFLEKGTPDQIARCLKRSSGSYYCEVFFLEAAIVIGRTIAVDGVLEYYRRKSIKIPEPEAIYLTFLAAKYLEDIELLSRVGISLCSLITPAEHPGYVTFAYDFYVSERMLDVRGFAWNRQVEVGCFMQWLIIATAFFKDYQDFVALMDRVCPELYDFLDEDCVWAYIRTVVFLEETFAMTKKRAWIDYELHKTTLIGFLHVVKDFELDPDTCNLILKYDSIGFYKAFVESGFEIRLDQYKPQLLEAATLGRHEILKEYMANCEWNKEFAHSILKCALGPVHGQVPVHIGPLGKFDTSLTIEKTKAASLVIHWCLTIGDNSFLREIPLRPYGYSLYCSSSEPKFDLNILLISRTMDNAKEFIDFFSPNETIQLVEDSPHYQSCSIDSSPYFLDAILNIRIVSDLKLMDASVVHDVEFEAIICTEPIHDEEVSSFLAWNISADYNKHVVFFSIQSKAQNVITTFNRSAPYFSGNLLKCFPVVGQLLMRGAMCRVENLPSVQFNCNREHKTHIYVLFGPSQSGKSAFINSFSGKHFAEEGTGAGISTTTICQEYAFTTEDGEFVFLDVPGLKDNYHNSTDEEIMAMIREKVLNHLSALALESGTTRKFIDGILLFEPLDYDYMRVDRTLLCAKMLFGEEVLDSGAVIFTKGDLDYSRPPEELTLSYCQWQSYPLSETVRLEDRRELKFTLRCLKPYMLKNMNDVLNRLDEMTKQAHAAQPKEFESVIVAVRKKVKVGETKTNKTLYKPPVTRYVTKHVWQKEDELQYPGRSYNEMKHYIRGKLFSETQNSGRLLWGPFRDLDYPVVEQHIDIAAEVALHTTKSNFGNARGYEYMQAVQRRFGSTGYPHNTVIYHLNGIVSAAYCSYGSGTPKYQKVDKLVQIQVPEPYSEPYTHTTVTPVYEERTVNEPAQVPKPSRPIGEFLEGARQNLIKQMKDSVTKK